MKHKHTQNHSCSHGCCTSDKTSCDVHECCNENNTTAVMDTISYTCPMHPDIKQDKPGSCPECGMNLVQVK